MVLYGYGKVLDVDLSKGKIEKIDVDPEFARKFIGGMGFSCRILYDEVGTDVDPFSPSNIVIFANGPLTGTQAPCSGRTEITTKSPLNGSIGTGNTGGYWGTALKRAGIAIIVVRNKAEVPVYLWINDDVAEIREANHLWGKNTRLTSDILREEMCSSHESQISVLTIGPAGENLVRYACPLNDYYHVAGRCCAGAVMGSKRLKAIAVRGTGTAKIARPEEFQKAVRDARERLMSAYKTRSMPGTPLAAQDRDIKGGCLPAKNFQSGVLPRWLETRGVDVARKYITKKDGTCYGCPVSCFNLAEVDEGKYAGTKANRGDMAGVVFEWGAKCAIDNLPAIWKCKELCQQLGMDYDTAGGAIAFAMELFQRGLITKNDTDGLELSWGNEDAVIQMLHKIAFRDGFGDTLAEGSAKAAAIIGKGSEKYVMTIKGMEIAMLPDPRSAQSPKGWLFGSLTNPRGGDNVKNTHFSADKYNPNWWVDKFDMFEDVKARIYSMPPGELATTWEGKVLMCRWFEDVFSAVNTLGLCFFPFGNYLALGPTHLSRLFSTCTGWDATPEDILKFGERIFTLLKAYTIRDGMTREDDNWPERFYTEPLPDGPAKGSVLSRETIKKLLDEYYNIRGWDKILGLPTAHKLIELGLHDIANELLELGKILKK